MLKTHVLLLFLALCSAHPTSDLSTIVENLSILTRVTNAIALQNSASRGNLKVRTVLADLYSLNEDFFTTLTTANTSLFMGELETLEKSIQATGELKTNGTATREMEDVISFLKDTFPIVSVIGDFKNFSAARLIEELRKSSTVEFPCEEITLKAVGEFTEYIWGEEKHSELIEQLRYQTLRSQTVKIRECFKACAAFGTAPEGTIVQEFRKLNDTYRLFHALSVYEGKFSMFEQMSEMLNVAALDVEKLLTLDKSRMELSNQTVRLILVSRELLEHWNGSKTLTAGFPDRLQDMLRVRGDLKSDWFREVISRKKSTRELEETLTPFFMFSEEVKTFDEKWEQLMSENSGLDFEEIRRVTERLMLIDRFNKDTGTLRMLNESRAIMHKCWSTTAAKRANKTKLEVYMREYLKQAEVFNTLVSATQKVVPITRFMSFETFDAFIQQVESILQRETQDVKKQKTAFETIPNVQELINVFHSISMYYDARMKFVTSFSNFRSSFTFNESTFHLAAEVEASKMLDLVGCLKNESFNTQDVHMVRESLNAVLEMSDKVKYDPVRQFLGKVQQVQEAIERVRNTTSSMRKSRRRRNPPLSPFAPISLRDSQELALDLAEGMNVLREMARVASERSTLLLAAGYSRRVMESISAFPQIGVGAPFWEEPSRFIEQVIDGIDGLELYSQGLRNGSLKTLRRVFGEAEKVPGIDSYKDVFTLVPEALKGEPADADVKLALDNAQKLSRWDLDFAKQRMRLKAADSSLGQVSSFFDNVFGFGPTPWAHRPIKKPFDLYSASIMSLYTEYGPIVTCIGLGLCVCVLLVAIAFGFTEKGKKFYTNTYLFVFPNIKEFERRWRYALFMDRENDQNALLEACRAGNSAKVETHLRRGAYVNVYNMHGNTALHLATKSGLPGIVSLLIKNGASRSLRNAQNKTPEQCIPSKIKDKRDLVAYDVIRKIYEKTKGKKYRVRVPQEFPTDMFHIYIEKRTDDSVTNMFCEKFREITSDDPIPTTTHCIFKTTSDGILETDDLQLLVWIFYGAIIVKECWMTECLVREKAIREDYKHLVKSVKFNDVVYKNCIIPWTSAQAKGEMPFLHGAYVVLVMRECPLLDLYLTLITSLGGEFLEEFPDKDKFNADSHPYLHSNLGPAFVIHDGESDLSLYRNDPDNIYTVFTEAEFIAFLLKRETHLDRRTNPIPQLVSAD